MSEELAGPRNDATGHAPEASESRGGTRERLKSIIAAVLAVDCLLLGVVILGATAPRVPEDGPRIGVEAPAMRDEAPTRLDRAASTSADVQPTTVLHSSAIPELPIA